MIEFSGIDILLDVTAGNDEIRNAVADGFGLHPNDVAVTDDIMNYPPGATMVCLLRPVEGDFCALIDVQCRPIKIDVGFLDTAIQLIADKLGRRCLVPDSEPNPYTMRLFAPRSAPIAVSLDVNAYDENRYILSKTYRSYN